jgi:hypothetical protein
VFSLDDLRAAFAFGLAVAEHAHGIQGGANDSSDRVLSVVRRVAAGDLTLLDTPEEVAAGAGVPDEAKALLRDLVRDMQLTQQTMARLLLACRPGPKRRGRKGQG